MAWLYLWIAVVIEVAWALSLKWTEGFTRLWPSLLCIALAGSNIFILSKAFRVLPTATAYAVWTGLGAVGITIFAMLFQGEPFSYLRVLFIVFIIVGVIGLRLVTRA